jgi:hypothetical protein
MKSYKSVDASEVLPSKRRHRPHVILIRFYRLKKNKFIFLHCIESSELNMNTIETATSVIESMENITNINYKLEIIDVEEGENIYLCTLSLYNFTITLDPTPSNRATVPTETWEITDDSVQIMQTNSNGPDSSVNLQIAGDKMTININTEFTQFSSWYIMTPAEKSEIMSIFDILNEVFLGTIIVA